MTSDQQQTNHSRRRLDPEVLAGMKAKMAEKVRSTPFEIKASPGPLSSFLEQLMEDIDNNLQTAAGMYAPFPHYLFLSCTALPENVGVGFSTRMSQAHDDNSENLQNSVQGAEQILYIYIYAYKETYTDREDHCINHAF